VSPLNVVAFVLGSLLVLRAILSAVRTFVLPRASNDAITAAAFRLTRRVFFLFAGDSKPYPTRDRLMAFFGPVSLIVLPGVWLLLVFAGYAALFWSFGVDSIYEAFAISGSSLLTLGFDRPTIPGGDLLSFTEAIIGLGLLALLISYLPTIYGAFARRELLVSLLEVRADSPPSPLVLITRFHRLHGLENLHGAWERWEPWFAELEESHTSLPVLVHYRSQQPDHSWVNAAGAMLDSAAIVRSCVATPMDVQADLMIRAGYLALRRIAGFFGITYEPNPSPDMRTSIDRARFDQAIEVLARAGVPIVPDRDQAWRDFNGWRVNYDQVLRGLERLTIAPTPWWDRPMRSAWATDEPVAEVASAHGADLVELPAPTPEPAAESAAEPAPVR
jgi:hypothetical protein